MIDKLFTRDNLTWKLTALASVLAYVVAHTSLVPPAYMEKVKDISGLLRFLAALFGNSPLPNSRELNL